jgi:hypothetical protein
MPARPNFALPSMISGYQEGKEKIRKRRSENAKAFQDYIKYLGDSGIEADAEALQNWAQLQFGMDAYANPMFSQDALESIATAQNERVKRKKLDDAFADLERDNNEAATLKARLASLLADSPDPETARRIFEENNLGQYWEKYAPYVESWADEYRKSKIDEALKSKWIEGSLDPDNDIEINMGKAPAWLKSAVKDYIEGNVGEKRRLARVAVANLVRQIPAADLRWASDADLKAMIKGFLESNMPGGTYDQGLADEMWGIVVKNRDVSLKAQDAEWRTSIAEKMGTVQPKDLVDLTENQLRQRARLIAGQVDPNALKTDDTQTNKLVEMVLGELLLLRDEGAQQRKINQDVSKSDAIARASLDQDSMALWAKAKDDSLIRLWAESEADKARIPEDQREQWVDDVVAGLKQILDITRQEIDTQRKTDQEITRDTQTLRAQEEITDWSNDPANQVVFQEMNDDELKALAEKTAENFSAGGIQVSVDDLYKILKDRQKGIYELNRRKELSSITTGVAKEEEELRNKQKDNIANATRAYDEKEADAPMLAVQNALNGNYYVPEHKLDRLAEEMAKIEEAVLDNDISVSVAVSRIVEALGLSSWSEWRNGQVTGLSSNIGPSAGSSLATEEVQINEDVAGYEREMKKKIEKQGFTDEAIQAEKAMAIALIENAIYQFQKDVKFRAAWIDYSPAIEQRVLANLRAKIEQIKEMEFDAPPPSPSGVNYDKNNDGINGSPVTGQGFGTSRREARHGAEADNSEPSATLPRTEKRGRNRVTTREAGS